MPAVDITLSDGWNLVCSRPQEVYYLQDGRQQFSLKYADPADGVTVCVQEASAFPLRIGVLYGMLLALYKKCVGLHGVVLRCGGKNVILSAPSETGKSTLARLLQDHYGNVRVINGDFAMLSLSDEGVIFEPTPFCGTSGICLNERFRIDHIVFLEQAETARWHTLNGREAVSAFMGNSFIPTWNHELRQEVTGSILRMLPCVRVHSFAFAPDKEAVRVFLENLIADDLHNINNTQLHFKEDSRMSMNKLPTSKEEMDELYKQVRKEIDIKDLDSIAGGEGGTSSSPVPWICPFCGTTIMARTIDDCRRHMPKCPNNPYKE